MANKAQKNQDDQCDNEVLQVFRFIESEYTQLQDRLTLFSNENYDDDTVISYERNKYPSNLHQNFTYSLSLLDCTEEEAKNLACDFTCKRIISFIVTISNLSFNAYFEKAYHCFFEIYNRFRNEFENQSLLAVMEQSPNKGYLLHILYISTRSTTKNELQGLCALFSKLKVMIHNITNNQEGYSTEGPFSIMVSGEYVKSPGVIFKYLQKQMLCVFCNNCDLAKAFMHFKRDYVFPKDSTPKVRKVDSSLTMT